MKQSLLCALALSASLSGAWAQGDAQSGIRDPFAPAIGAGISMPGELGSDASPPLLQYPAQEYQLMGILTSSQGGIAIVQTPAGARYYVREGDALGAEGFTIKSMKKISLHLKTKKGDALVLTAKNAGGSE